MKMIFREDRRKFNRFSLDLLMKITGVDRDGIPYVDRTNLKNVSGGGAKFSTRHVDRYMPGQELEITIYLPGINDVKARMKGKATVLRVERLDEVNEEAPVADIALAFNGRLRFTRE